MDRNGLSPIELGITINGSRKFINCAMRCSPIEFGYKRKPRHIQDYIDSQRVIITNIVTEMARQGIPLTTDTLRSYIRTGGVMSYTIRDLFDDYFKILRKRINVDLTEKVFDKYKLVERVFSEHIDFSKELTSITPSVIQDFYATLKSKYQDSTSCGMMTKLHTVIKFAIDNGKLKINPFQSIKISRGDKPIEMLSDIDFESIRTKVFDCARIERVRDIFIFACGSGLAYADLKNLKPDDFKMVDGQMCIIKERCKTHNTFVSVLLPCAVEVAKKYNFELGNIVPSNQKLNAYCTEIKDICKVKSVSSLHSHLGRHWYCNHLLNAGVRPEVVAKAAGHKNYKTLLKYYARVEDSTTIKEIKAVL